MKRFMNAKASIVTEALDGFLATSSNARLARLDGYPHTKVIVRTDWDQSRVALVAGEVCNLSSCRDGPSLSPLRHRRRTVSVGVGEVEGAR